MRGFLAIAALVLPMVAAAEVDGIWSNPTGFGYSTIHTNGNSLVFVFLDHNEQATSTIWEAYSGAFDGTTAELVSQIPQGSVEITMRIVFSSDNEATMQLTGCTPAENCAFPIGTIFPFEKLY